MKALITYTPQERDNPYVRLLIDALAVKGIEVVHPRSGRFWLWRSVMSAPRPDIVHLQWQHGYFTGATFFNALRRSAQFFTQLLAIRLAGTPVVWTVHNLINHEGKQRRWELLMCRILARSVNALLVHCDSVVAQVAHVYRISPRRIRVVPHGHYLGVYSAPKERASARRNLGLTADGLVILFFGQIRAYKGIQELVEVFGRLRNPGIRLILAGEPKMEGLEELRERVRADTRVITDFDFISDERLVEYLSACDLVVLPYRQSLTSGAAILAASYARPIVAPRLGCMQEFPEEGAILFDPDSARGLERALHLALAAPLDEMGLAARAYVETFPWSKAAERTSETYADACKTR